MLSSFTRFLFPRAPKKPFLGDNTFFLWEPCTHSHAEVLPGYAAYLIDLGFEVSVLMAPTARNAGLFSRFNHPRIHLNDLSQREAYRYFLRNGLAGAKGVLLTSARKLAHYRNPFIRNARDYAYDRKVFAGGRGEPPGLVLLVEHDMRDAAAADSLAPNIITLRRMEGYDSGATMVNPHYFGEVRHPPKNTAPVNFLTVGGKHACRRNLALLTDAAISLENAGCPAFRITLAGQRDKIAVDAALARHVNFVGPVDFTGLYREMEAADFLLALLDADLFPWHRRYLTTATSGMFQLVYGFRKPCLVHRAFAAANGFDEGNSLLFGEGVALADAMREAIRLPPGAYDEKRRRLGLRADALYAESRDNLRRLIYG